VVAEQIVDREQPGLLSKLYHIATRS